MNKEVAEYINSLLAERERLLEERKDDYLDYGGIPELSFTLKQETDWELAIIAESQKALYKLQSEVSSG